MSEEAGNVDSVLPAYHCRACHLSVDAPESLDSIRVAETVGNWSLVLDVLLVARPSCPAVPDVLPSSQPMHHIPLLTTPLDWEVWLRTAVRVCTVYVGTPTRVPSRLRRKAAA